MLEIIFYNIDEAIELLNKKVDLDEYFYFDI